MDRTEFMSLFADLADSELHTLRESSRLNDLARDQSLYVDLCKQFFDGDPHNIDERQRFVGILIAMIHTDGRTKNALLWIADQAYLNPELYGGSGLNSLAAIWSFLQWAELTVDEKESIRGWMTKFQQEKTYLANNADQCLRLLDSRRD
jgi:hypothetical protein